MHVLRFFYAKIRVKWIIFHFSKCQNRALCKLYNKESLKCVFFCLFEEVWKFDDVYQLMERHPRFDPVIFVCPIINYDRENMLIRLNKCYKFFKERNYRVIMSYDERNNKYVDVVEKIKPDIIFYTNPYRGLIDDRYYITNYPNILTCYTNYCFFENKDMSFYNMLFNNLLWRFYCETPAHKRYCAKYSSNKGRNAVMTGYPGIEKLIVKKESLCYKDWKCGNDYRHKIIWAPHHTMEAVGNVHYSCFLQYSDFMIELAQKYKDKIQIVFKPHPLLKVKLYSLWGKNKTDDYYKQWAIMPNTSLNESLYYDLFLTSDAIIHDSASFIAEYLFVNKPALRTMNGIPVESLYNDFTIDCLKCYYKAYSCNDIENFVQNVINDVDSLMEYRTKFVNEVLKPKCSPSQAILDDILDSIDNQILYRN